MEYASGRLRWRATLIRVVKEITNGWMSIKLKDVKVKVIKEKDGSYAIACSSLGVYSMGETLREARANFREALDLHLSALRENALKEVELISTV